MKFRIIQGIVAVTVLSFGALTYGQTSNAIPSEATFEEMTENQSILDFPGWYGDPATTNAFAISYTNTSWEAGAVLYPLPSAAHTKVLQFADGVVTNQFETYAAAKNMTVDFMIQPVRSEEAPLTNLLTDCQTAMFLDSNGFLNVWYGIDNSGNVNDWMTYTNIPPLGTTDWARVTVAFDYTGDLASGGGGDTFFRINVNGLLLTPTNALGYGIELGSGYVQNGGNSLRTANPTPNQILSFALSGSGMLDDFVITTNAVTNFFPAPLGSYALTGSVVNGHGTISPSSTNVSSGGSAAFDVVAAGYYRIASLTTNGGSAGNFNNNSTATNFTWSNVLGDGALVAVFTPQVVNNAAQTPYWWLAQYGLTNGGDTFEQAAEADQDHDGMVTWQECIVDTVPTNAASVLKVLSVTSDGVNDTVKWLSTTGAPNYSLIYSTNLQAGGNGWAMASNNIVIDAPTNTVIVPQTVHPAFYKITVTY